MGVFSQGKRRSTPRFGNPIDRKDALELYKNGLTADKSPVDLKISAGAVTPDLESIAILIPAFNPYSKLIEIVSALIGAGFRYLLVVDDGSKPACREVFHSLRRLGVHVAHSQVNRGKGAALKAGFEWIQAACPNLIGVVTADADGQHTVEDIVSVARELVRTPKPVLGTRRFSVKVPFRSKIGNSFTRSLFRFVTGTTVSDTQTGLRGFPIDLLPELLVLQGDRYEYETVVLAHLCRTGRQPLEVPIETIYLEGNESSHFRPVRDSLLILKALLTPRSVTPNSQTATRSMQVIGPVAQD